VQWPSAEGQKEISFHIGSYTGFQNCVGFINGTLFPLNEKPTIDPQDYYSHKGMYGLASLIVCDQKKKIVYYLTGWPGN
jgi:hypothetical protein